jgi:arsenite methyltransferase
MTALPFEDNSFDVVHSSLAIHTITEAVRVLRPKGWLMITDVWATTQYQAKLARMGMNDVVRRRPGNSGEAVPRRLPLS